jgi:NAD(P)-dependent dehydrogenase (short-subunit alcohol dehydrogenase family)
MYRAKPEDGIAFVTGASSGIGRATALELARRGYRVAATARRHAELDALASEAKGIVVFQGDVTDAEAVMAMVASIERDVGPIALAFLNAGVAHMAERGNFNAALLAKTFAVNVQGVANTLAPLIAAMLARGKGQIAINGSMSGYNGLPATFAYGSSKAALINLTESLWLAYGDRGLTFQLVSPGFVRTPMTDAEKDYQMPFMVEADAAAKIICDGFERKGFDIAFPWQLAALSKFVRILPYGLRLPFIRATARSAEKK